MRTWLVYRVYCRAVYPLYWLAGLSVAVLLTVSAKLHSVTTHLGAMAVLDYGQKLDAYVEEQRNGFGGWRSQGRG